MNLPTIGIIVHFLSTKIHPEDEAMIPQGDPTLWLPALNTQQPQNLGSNLFSHNLKIGKLLTGQKSMGQLTKTPGHAWPRVHPKP
jgi:hypothetical protein